MILSKCNFDKSWTLFLDRDGVINRRIVDDYVKTPQQFEFLPGVLESLALFSNIFGRIVVVTNQQGIGKGLMTEQELAVIHDSMIKEIAACGGRIDRVYFSPHLKKENSFFRKPAVGMGLQARKDFPEINFRKSLIIGDSISDMEFGKRLGMRTVFITDDIQLARRNFRFIDAVSSDMASVAKEINV